VLKPDARSNSFLVAELSRVFFYGIAYLVSVLSPNPV